MTIASPSPGDTGSAADRIEATLRRAILELVLSPGARLSEAEIAQQYGVSRQPVREALIRLARTGLVSARPGRGTVVVKIDPRELGEALFVRQAVEVAVVEKAVENFDPRQRKLIDIQIGKQQAAARAQDLSAFRELDQAFHAALAYGAGVGVAWNAIADLKAHMDRVANLTLKTETDLLRHVREHKAIVQAIDDKERKAARRAMANHLGAILDHLPELEAGYPHLFQ